MTTGEQKDVFISSGTKPEQKKLIVDSVYFGSGGKYQPIQERDSARRGLVQMKNLYLNKRVAFKEVESQQKIEVLKKVSQIYSPSIEAIHGFVVDNADLKKPRMFLESDWLQCPLSDRLQLKCNLVDAARMSMQIGLGLGQLHRAEIMYGSLDESHVVFDSVRESNAKLTSFALSRLKGEQNTPISNEDLKRVNSNHIAPEMRNGSVTERSDIYMYASLLHQIFIGLPSTPETKKAFAEGKLREPIFAPQYESIFAKKPEVKKQFITVLRTALQTDALMRFPSIKLMTGKLQNVFSQLFDGRTDAFMSPLRAKSGY